MGSEVNEVINNICSKLGYVASEITPEMAKYMIAKNIALCVILAAFLTAFIIAGVTAYKRYRKAAEDSTWYTGELEIVIMVFSAIALVVIIAVLADTVVDLVGWMASPKASMVEYVLHLIK